MMIEELISIAKAIGVLAVILLIGQVTYKIERWWKNKE